MAQASYGGRTLMVPGENEGSARCWGWSSRGVQTVLRPGFPPKAGFSSPGSAIAYSAYSIPNVMVNTTFHDYYVPLAVLNTIISTGLSCYSRYPAAAPQRAGEAQWKGSRVHTDVPRLAGPASWARSLGVQGDSTLGFMLALLRGRLRILLGPQFAHL